MFLLPVRLDATKVESIDMQAQGGVAVTIPRLIEDCGTP